MYTYTSIYLSIYLYIHMYIYIYTDMYIHIYTHKQSERETTPTEMRAMEMYSWPANTILHGYSLQGGALGGGCSGWG